MSNRVVHFEIEAQNMERATKFYSQAFGWEMQKQGAEYGDYVVVVSGKPDEIGINGGIFKGASSKELNAYSCVIAVDDVQKSMSDVKAAGGKVFGEPVDIPMIG